MATIRDVANDAHYHKSIRDAASRLTAAGYGDVGVASGVRSKAENRKAGGAKKSQHIHGKAIDISGAKNWSPEQKRGFLSAAAASGFKGIGLYNSGAMHIDTRRSPAFWGPAGYKGSNIKNMPAWSRDILASIQKGTAFTPRPQVDVGPAAVAGVSPTSEVAQSAPAWSAAPALSTPGYSPGSVQRMALSPVSPTRMSPSALSPSALSPAQRAIDTVSPAGPAQERFAPSAAPKQDRVQSQAVDPNFGGINPSSLMGSQNFPGISMPATPTGPLGGETLYAKAVDPSTFAPALSPALTSPTPMAQAPAALGPAPTGLTGAFTDLGVAPGALQQMPAQEPVAPVETPPAVAPVQTQVVEQLPTQSPAPVEAPTWTAPSLTPGDIYGGEVGTAAATGGNFVSRDNFGTTSVTNPYGATTAMTPGGYQSAYGGTATDAAGAPAWAGGNPFSGLGAGLGNLGKTAIGLDPGQSYASQKNGFKGKMIGALLGGLVAGVPGALAGGYFGAKMGAKKDFPDKPSGGEKRNGRELSRSERASISPAADRSMASNNGRQTGLW